MLFVICVAESCANDEYENKMMVKKLSKDLFVQVSDTTKAGLCIEAGFIKNKNKHKQALLLHCKRFTQKLRWKI